MIPHGKPFLSSLPGPHLAPRRPLLRKSPPAFMLSWFFTCSFMTYVYPSHMMS